MKIFVTVFSHWRGDTWYGIVDVGAHKDPTGINEFLFRYFNRVYRHDSERLEEANYDLPSLSVNDTLTWGGKTYRVENMGFSEVS